MTAMDDELKQLLDTMRQESSAAHEDTRRHFDVALESAKHEVRLVAESVAQVNEELRRTRTTLDETIERTAAETQRIDALAGEGSHSRQPGTGGGHLATS
jgi:hypothetical protein